MSESSPERVSLGDLRAALGSTFAVRSWGKGLRHPARAMRELTGGAATFPLLVLFGLNCVDELDRTAFGILLPNIRDAFGMSNSGVLALVAFTALGALALQMPIAAWADRSNRVFIALAGAVVWGLFSVFTGAATATWMLIVARAGTGIGRAVVDPTHNSLLSDYYSVDRRPAVFGFHRAANVVGQFIGPLLAGALAAAFSWRAPFYVFAVPTLILVVLGTRMREPVRGAQERRSAGASADAVLTEEPLTSFAESWRLLWKIEVLRRIWYAVPFLAVSLIGFVSIASLMYADVYRLDELQRGYLAAAVEPFQLVGLAVGARLGMRLYARDPALIFSFLRWAASLGAVFAAGFALAPNLALAVVFNVALTMVLATLLPGILATLSLAIPARARAVGFSVASWWAIPGLALLPVMGWIGDAWGTRAGLLILSPILLTGGWMISTGSKVVRRDIEDVWRSSAARSQALVDRREGRAKLLSVHDLNVSYGSLQVLFDVNIEVGEGEVVALLGTNGAGKSTLLRAITGVTEADFGAVIYDGRDITHAPPNEIAALGIGQLPGGAGVFEGLSVEENLRTAAWQLRHDPDAFESQIESMLDRFPVLEGRRHDPAGNLSGGQQQMLALAMALMTRPKLLIIDELSLGLAPLVVAELAELVRGVAASGTSVLIVEQSVNVALTLASRVYFMERGQVRFSGPAHEIVDQPNMLRSVFLSGGAEELPLAVNGGSPHGRSPQRSPKHASRADAAALELVGVTRRFGGINAVDSVDLVVGRDEIVGLVGQNGAGKTTILDLICGLQRLDKGKVLLSGQDISRWSQPRRARCGLGRTFQGGRLFPGLTVAETIAVSLDRTTEVRDPFNAALRMPASYESETDVARRVEQLLDIFGLGEYRDCFTSELSTGSRRIVELACVVGHRPSVLLLDEPAAGVAQAEVEALGELLRHVRRELGCAMVIIEHDMPLVAGLSDRLVALESGSVIAVGTPQEVLADPAVISSYLGVDRSTVNRSGTR